jgi:hypothetical protein
MPEPDDTQRFDRLLEAMVTKPPLEITGSSADDSEDQEELE